MATSDFQSVLTARGFESVANDKLPTPMLPVTNAFREPTFTGRRTIDGAVVEVQLQAVNSFNGSGWAAAARIAHPSIRGEGMLRGRMLWGTYRALTSGPKVAVAIMAILMFTGIGLVMLPGMFLAWLMFRGMLGRLGVSRFDDLRIEGLKSRFFIWGRDHDGARDAFPPALQQALLDEDWFGSCEVRDGALLLDKPVGYGRVDLFEALIAAAEASASAIANPGRARL